MNNASKYSFSFLGLIAGLLLTASGAQAGTCTGSGSCSSTSTQCNTSETGDNETFPCYVKSGQSCSVRTVRTEQGQILESSCSGTYKS